MTRGVVYLKGDESDEEALQLINNAISNMTSYGRVHVPFPKSRRGYIMEWSTGHADWCPPGYYNVNHPEAWPKRSGVPDIDLDANELMVVGLTKQRLEKLIPSFIELPLHTGSFEARMAGRFSLEGIDAPPAIREIAVEQAVEWEEGGPRSAKYLSN